MPKNPSTKSPAPEGFYTRKEAAKACGVSFTTFRRWEKENEIEGVKIEGDGPNARRLYPIKEIEELEFEDAQEERDAIITSMIKETAKAATEIHRSSKLAIDAAVQALQGTDPRTVALFEELNRLREHTRTLEEKGLLVWDLLHKMHEARIAELEAIARRERDQIVSTGRQDMMIDSFRMAWPGIVHRLLPSKETEKPIIASVFAHLSESNRAKLMAMIGELPTELQASAGALIGDALEEEAKRREAKVEAEKKNAPPAQANGASTTKAKD
jgi:DNA-binding transcriptional MerR regulator